MANNSNLMAVVINFASEDLYPLYDIFVIDGKEKWIL
jgi:hypothetical protein